MSSIAFFAGLPETGEERLAALFEANNLATTRWDAGRLVSEFAYRRLAGESVRALLKGYDLLIGWEQKNWPGRPFLTEFEELDHLLQSFPDSLLIFNETDEEQWLQRMKSRDGGKAASLQASWLGISEEDLPELWSQQYATQRERVVKAAESGASAVFLNSAAGFGEWRDCLSPWFELSEIPASGTVGKRASRQAAGKREPSGLTRARALEVTETLSRHCLGTLQAAEKPGAAFSEIYAEWDGVRTVTKRDGSPFPVRFGTLGGQLRCLARPGVKKANRVEGVVNEVLSNGSVRPLRMDMQDCRLYGVEEGYIPAERTLTYCRRAGAKNVVLWPLPEYHSIGAINFVGGGGGDQIRFDEKTDTLFWRGAISGHCSDVVRNVFSDEVWQVAGRLAAQPESEALWEQFSSCTRVSVLERYGSIKGFDLQFVSGQHFEFFRTHPRTAHLCGSKVNRLGMLRHRYILSMRGYDTGSNFVPAANSNSVVLKEEDGWELFYTPLFRAWESYIPLAPGLPDLEEKLDWARRNPERCIEISRNARAACSYLASPEWRRLLLRSVAEGI